VKIVLIGPTYPFRGGISHYTTLLCQALRERHEVKFISFSRQYPAFLFPGDTDRDPSAEPIRVAPVDYLIDSLNPCTWFKAARAIVRYEPAMVVLPWWVAFWAPQFFIIVTLIKRRIGAEIVFICHNAEEHESNFLKKSITRVVLSWGDRLITHSSADTGKLKNLLGQDADIITAFHPTYADLSRQRPGKDEARAILGISGTTLLFFGFVRAYKGLDVLLEALPMVLKKRRVTLVVAGEFWKDKQKYFAKIEENNLGSAVKVVDRYIPNEEIGSYFAATDLVVQPYRSASGSGITQLAYGFGKPVIATRVGSLGDVIHDGKNGRLVPPGDGAALGQAILDSLHEEVLPKMTAAAEQTGQLFSWTRLVDILLAGSK